MKMIIWLKCFKNQSMEYLTRAAGENGFAGYDLCVRDGFPVNFENAGTMLKEVASEFRREGVEIPMITGPTDLVFPDDIRSEILLKAMDESDVRLLKIGYFKFDPVKDHFWTVMENSRRTISGWEKLAEKYNVKICYHTHNGSRIGSNCAGIMHLLRGFNPNRIGAYIDTCHLVLEGEEFDSGFSMVKEYLSVIAFKDVLLERKKTSGFGRTFRVVPAGGGMVDWDNVFSSLAAHSYKGLCSLHCAFEATEETFYGMVKREFVFFRELLANYPELSGKTGLTG